METNNIVLFLVHLKEPDQACTAEDMTTVI